MDSVHQIAERLKKVSDTSLLDARLLYEGAKGNKVLLESYLVCRLNHEPISKILGYKGFWKSDFVTSCDVLDPRPDSEMIIEAVVRTVPQNKDLRILDIGTGSGCLLFSLLDEYPKAIGTGVDKSENALKIAGKNKGKRHAELKQIDFMKRDWAKGLGQFDVIVSNPPYIPTAEIRNLALEVRQYDPLMALDGGVDGLDAYRALSETVSDILKTNGYLFLEIGVGQKDSVRPLFEMMGLTYRITYSDFGGIPRVMVFEK